MSESGVVEQDMSVLDDPAADEAYIHLQRNPDGLTVETLSAKAGLAAQDAAAGLRLLKEGGLATSADDELFLMRPDADDPAFAPREAGGTSAPEEVTEAARAPEDASERPPPPAPGLTQLKPEVVLALARGERVRMIIRAEVENVEGKLDVVNVLGIEEARLPGERPFGE